MATNRSRAHRSSARRLRGIRDRAWSRVAASTTSLSGRAAATLRPFATIERALPLSVAAIVAVASLLAVVPSTPAGAVGGVQGSGPDVRIAVNGGIDAEEPTSAVGYAHLEARMAEAGATFRPVTLPRTVETRAEATQTPVEPGPVLDDGTLITGYAPDTAVEDGADLIRKYKVAKGDTLYDIALKFDVKVRTLWWANKIDSTNDLHIGQVLRIPPVNGLVYTVSATDTLESIAATYKIDADRIVTLNELQDPTVVVGQVLILPGAKGIPIPAPKPAPHHAAKTKAPPKSAGPSHHHPSPRPSGPTHYTGGRFHWPVIGGGNHISQYFHYGHEAIDIAADYGSKVVAAAGGRVTFAGWKNNGGGWQVWISHGNNLYTTYNHMSALTVGTGQSVGRGQQVGRIGQSGWATGPHLHFEVWIGPIWNGGTRVNPLRYF